MQPLTTSWVCVCCMQALCPQGQLISQSHHFLCLNSDLIQDDITQDGQTPLSLFPLYVFHAGSLSHSFIFTAVPSGSHSAVEPLVFYNYIFLITSVFKMIINTKTTKNQWGERRAVYLYSGTQTQGNRRRFAEAWNSKQNINMTLTTGKNEKCN